MNGAVTTSWNGKLSGGEVLYTLVFRAKEDGLVSDYIKVNSEMTTAEAYSIDGSLLEVNVSFGSTTVTEEFVLYQNVPNPFGKSSLIGFELPESGEATLVISDLSGKVVKVVNGEFSKGYNQVEVKRSDLPAAGVYSYQLRSGAHIAVKKMILID
jgi:hypothetical protein